MGGGWAFSFLCFGIVECAHGHAYAKQVRIMCVLSVPLLDQVQGVLTMGSGLSPGTGSKNQDLVQGLDMAKDLVQDLVQGLDLAHDPVQV